MLNSTWPRLTNWLSRTSHLLDQPGYVRRDLHDVGTDVPVAGPGREHVVHHHAPDHDHGEAHDQQGQDHATKG